MLKISNYGPGKYIVENADGRIHMLGLDALKWNLKKVFGLSGADVLAIVVSLGVSDSVSVDLEKKAA